MPVIKELHFNFKTKLVLWEIEESKDELEQLVSLSSVDKEKLALRKSPSHQRELLSSRASLSALGVSLDDLQFRNNGAPYIKNLQFCSLSHTFLYAAAAISDRSIGVDVEIYRSNIVRIAPKFLHSDEAFVLENENKIALLTRLWCAKESVYKAFGTAGIHFAKQIQISPFTIHSEEGFARLQHLGKEYSFTLHFRSILKGELCLAIKES